MCETCHNGIHPVGEGTSAVKAQYLIPSIQEGPGKKQPRADDEVVKSFLVWKGGEREVNHGFVTEGQRGR